MIGHELIHAEKLVSGDTVTRSRQVSAMKQTPIELTHHIAAMGPTPRVSLETFVDLSLSDDEIANYFDVPRNVITQLRGVWGITA